MSQQYDLKCGNLSSCSDYEIALVREIWAYFFMRGIEGRFWDYPRPYYKGNSTAHYWWTEGNRYAKSLYPVNPHPNKQETKLMCDAFLTGTSDLMNAWECVGIEARAFYENARKQSIKAHRVQASKKPKSKKPRKEKPMSGNPLYKVKSEETYGFVVGKDSKGRLLLEIKGNGSIRAFEKEELEEVLPYTICVRHSGYTEHYLTEDGLYEKGDILLIQDDDDFGLARVIEVNTRYKNASEEMSSFVLGKIQLSKIEKVAKAE